MKNKFYWLTSVFLVLFISCSSDSGDEINLDSTQKWKTVKNDYTYVYNISNFGTTLYITGRKEGNFIFASSEDNGDNWKEVVLNDNISLENGIPICVGFINAQDGIIGIKGSFAQQYLKTNDGGLTWENYTINISEACNNIPQPQEIIIIDESTLIISRFQSANYIISRDGGNSWECSTDFSVANPPNFLAFDANRFLNFDQEGIYESSDHGATWETALSMTGLSTYEMYDEARGFAITSPFKSTESNPQLYITSDAWNTFQSIPVSSLSGKWVSCIVPVTEDELFFFEAENIYFSTDGGSTLSLTQTIEFEPTHSKKINDEWYVTGRGLAKYNPNGKVGQ